MSTLTEIGAEIRGALFRLRDFSFTYVTLVYLSRGDSVIRLNFLYYFAKMFIDSIGGHFLYVNVDIRGVVLSMSTHVNERG